MTDTATNAKRDISDRILIVVFLLLSSLLVFLPTGFERMEQKRVVRCKGEVIAVDNSEVQLIGMIYKGSQDVTLKLLNGPFEGEMVDGLNQLFGQMDRDKIFKIGDKALTVLELDESGQITTVNPYEHYRLDWELGLLAAFALFLIWFARIIGLKAVLSFGFTILMIWKILIPSLLKGYDPILVSLGVVLILTAAIIFLVAGVNKMGLTAFLGSFSGIGTAALLSVFFTRNLHLHGAVLPFAETLLYSGYNHLNITRIFVGAIFIAACGAIMDLSMDVSAAMHEVKQKKPDIGILEIIQSGFFVSRAVLGTMTTTLLFAYSGSYITLLMAFMAQNIPVVNIVNLVYVSSEIIKTLVGSFGLVLVAPFTAIIGGFIYGNVNPLTLILRRFKRASDL